MGKELVGGLVLATTTAMASSPTVYVQDFTALDRFRTGLKLHHCPHCHQPGFLIFHGPMMGYATTGHEKQQRGQRVFCSNRFRKRGCGKTFGVLLASLLKSWVISAALIAGFIARVISGASRQAAWQELSCGFSLESAYRIWNRWLDAQSHLRSWLSRKISPPQPAQTGPPWHQCWQHLLTAFSGSLCPIAAFQQHFGQGFFPH